MRWPCCFCIMWALLQLHFLCAQIRTFRGAHLSPCDCPIQHFAYSWDSITGRFKSRKKLALVAIDYPVFLGSSLFRKVSCMMVGCSLKHGPPQPPPQCICLQYSIVHGNRGSVRNTKQLQINYNKYSHRLKRIFYWPNQDTLLYNNLN